MIASLLVGSLMIVGLMGLAAILFVIAARMLRRLDRSAYFKGHRNRPIFEVGIGLIWILAVNTISVWAWAMAYLALGVFDQLEPALYFSIVSFTTLGYGDIILGEDWRLLAGMTATNGLIMIGLFTAFLVEILDMRGRSGRRR